MLFFFSKLQQNKRYQMKMISKLFHLQLQRNLKNPDVTNFKIYQMQWIYNIYIYTFIYFLYKQFEIRFLKIANAINCQKLLWLVSTKIKFIEHCNLPNARNFQNIVCELQQNKRLADSTNSQTQCLRTSSRRTSKFYPLQEISEIHFCKQFERK